MTRRDRAQQALSTGPRRARPTQDIVHRPLTPKQKTIMSAHFPTVGTERTARECGLPVRELRTLVRHGWLRERYPDRLDPTVLLHPEWSVIFRRLK